MALRGGLWKAVALAAAALGALVVAAPAGATFPGANGFVVFQSNRDGDYDLFAQNLDGSNLRKLVDRPGTNEFNPSWSPSGNRLVFQSGPTNGSDFDLYLVGADGTGLTPLIVGSTLDRAAQFCDEDTIVFQRNVAGSGDVYAVEIDGSGLRRLTDDPASDSTPTCSPDGAKVAFSSTRNGVQGIYELPLASAQAGRVPLVAVPTLLVANAFDADYSPDGDDLGVAGFDPADRSVEVFTVDLDTREVKQISSSAPPLVNRLPKFFPESDAPAAAARTPAEVDDSEGDDEDDDPMVWTPVDGQQESLDANVAPCPETSRRISLGLAALCFAAIKQAGAGVIQPLLRKCPCKNLTVGIPKKSVGSAEGQSIGASLTRLFFDIEWDLTCAAGIGKKCKGTLELGVPKGFKINSMRRVVKKGGKTKLNPVATDHPVSCEGTCSLLADTTTAGTFRVAVNSPKTKAELAGSRLSLDIVTTCSAGKATTTILISFGANGKVKSVAVKQ